MGYLKREIAKRIDETPRTIQFWTDQGMVIPDIDSKGGRGKAKVYSETNLIEFAMIKFMKDRCAIPLNFIREILSGLRQGSYKGVVFDDFFQNSDWGKKKELVYIAHGYSGTGPRGFHIAEKNALGMFDINANKLSVSFSTSIANSYIFTTLMLGQIKKRAKELL